MNYTLTALRITFLYFFLIVILRFLGKREVGQLSIFDLVILLIIADIASMGIDEPEFYFSGILCVLVLAVLQKVLSYILLKFPALRGIIDGNPRIIVIDGKIKYKNMKKELYTIDDLTSQMRLLHIMEISEIRLAVLETNGVLSIFRKSKFDSVALPVITSGKLVKESFNFLPITDIDILDALDKKKILIDDVLYASFKDYEISYYLKDNKKEDIEVKKLVIKKRTLNNQV